MLVRCHRFRFRFIAVIPSNMGDIMTKSIDDNHNVPPKAMFYLRFHLLSSFLR